MSPVIRAVGLFHFAQSRTPRRSSEAETFPLSPIFLSSVSDPSIPFGVIFCDSIYHPTIPCERRASGTWIPTFRRNDITFMIYAGSLSRTFESWIIFRYCSCFVLSLKAVWSSSVEPSKQGVRNALADQREGWRHQCARLARP